MYYVEIFIYKQKTAYKILVGDWSSDVCSSILVPAVWLQRNSLLFGLLERQILPVGLLQRLFIAEECLFKLIVGKVERLVVSLAPGGGGIKVPL